MQLWDYIESLNNKLEDSLWYQLDWNLMQWSIHKEIASELEGRLMIKFYDEFEDEIPDKRDENLTKF